MTYFWSSILMGEFFSFDDDNYDGNQVLKISEMFLSWYYEKMC